MRITLALFLASVSLGSATTLEVLRVFQPLSLHGTDVDHEFEGESIQARILSRPMVLSGAMPETLIAAIGEAHRMPSTLNYDVKECNLLQLYGVGLSGFLTEKAILEVTLDVGKVKVPEGVELPIRTVLRLAIEALKQTLAEYHHPENGPLRVQLKLIGLSDRTASLGDLSGTFQVGGR